MEVWVQAVVPSAAFQVAEPKHEWVTLKVALTVDLISLRSAPGSGTLSVYVCISAGLSLARSLCLFYRIAIQLRAVVFILSHCTPCQRCSAYVSMKDSACSWVMPPGWRAALQMGLCSAQCLNWQSWEQYLAIWHSHTCTDHRAL